VLKNEGWKIYFSALLYHLQNALLITPRLQKFRLRIRRASLSQPF